MVVIKKAGHPYGGWNFCSLVLRFIISLIFFLYSSKKKTRITNELLFLFDIMPRGDGGYMLFWWRNLLNETTAKHNTPGGRKRKRKKKNQNCNRNYIYIYCCYHYHHSMFYVWVSFFLSLVVVVLFCFFFLLFLSEERENSFSASRLPLAQYFLSATYAVAFKREFMFKDRATWDPFFILKINFSISTSAKSFPFSHSFTGWTLYWNLFSSVSLVFYFIV